MKTAIKVAAVLVVVALILIGSALTFGEHRTWNACRFLNQYLAIASVGFVMYRLVLMVGDPVRRRDERALHLIAWFAYVAAALLLASQGSAYYNASDTPAPWTAAGRTWLHCVAIGLSVWWPHPARLVHIEVRSGGEADA